MLFRFLDFSRARMLLTVIIMVTICEPVISQSALPWFHYTVSVPNPETHTYNVELRTGNWNTDSVQFHMPDWMPGYYQMMNYAKGVENFSVKDERGNTIPFRKADNNSWRVPAGAKKSFVISYTVRTTRQFVANSYVDEGRAYLIPENTFLYVDGFLHLPVSVTLVAPKWKDVATGLDRVKGKSDQFIAADFDILFDSPILIGNLEELPSFTVRGVNHRFIGYKVGSFDRVAFTDKLKKIVEAAVAIMGDIPYNEYTFIAIGPGQGGIEHLNNTTVSFDGNQLNTTEGMNRMMNFLAHEYFHHYNVKRIRPFELGPFDYENGNRTQLLWISEGISVYYEYLVVKRAGLVDAETLLSFIAGNVNAVENNPGRFHQSLAQSSYYTWRDGPFGNREPGKTISYYDKGPVVGMFLDFEIRHVTKNSKSLDDVMRLCYWRYYKGLKRGFTDAEFQMACEEVAGVPLSGLFEFVYTTKELDFAKYLRYAGLKLSEEPSTEVNRKKFTIARIESPDELQSAIQKSWLGE